MKNINKVFLLMILTFILVSPAAVLSVHAQTTGGSAPVDKYIYGNIYDKASNKPLFGALLTLYGSGGQSSSQKSNSAGGFGFIKASGTYSLYGSILGYQSNMCHFTVTTRPIKVTFVLAKLGTGPSSCDYTEQTESPTIAPVISPTTSDGTEGPSSVGVDATVSSPSNSSSNSTGASTNSNVVVNADGTITSRSNCVVTKIGNPTGSATLPAECQTSTEVPVGPGVSCQLPPNYPGDLKVAIKNRFGIDFLNFDQEHLGWFWEELWNTSGTKFTVLAKGAVVTADFCPGGGNFSCYAGGCRGVQQDGSSGPNLYFGSYQGETFNKTLIVHELGHYIMGCADEVNASFLSEFDQAHAAERGVTYYAQNANACAGEGVSNHNEDFAETVAYYLHPNSISQSINCGPNNGAPNPFYGTNGVRNSSFPRHFAWAQKALGVFACSGSSTIKQ